MKGKKIARKKRKRREKKKNLLLAAERPHAPLRPCASSWDEEEGRDEHTASQICNSFYQSLEGLDRVDGFVFRRCMGWSFLLISRRMAVFGCQSGKALRRLAKSFAKK
jgi:hypothetical protein